MHGYTTSSNVVPPDASKAADVVPSNTSHSAMKSL